MSTLLQLDTLKHWSELNRQDKFQSQSIAFWNLARMKIVKTVLKSIKLQKSKYILQDKDIRNRDKEIDFRLNLGSYSIEIYFISNWYKNVEKKKKKKHHFSRQCQGNEFIS